MSQSETRKRGIFSRIWRGVDLTRRVAMNLLFLIVLVFLLSFLFSSDEPEVPKSAALVLSPSGNVVEQLAGDPAARAIGKLLDNDEPEVLLRDMVDAVRAAKDDDRIQALYLRLDGLGGAGMTKLQDLKIAIEDFKTSGKRVVASADYFDRNRYYLASLADEVHMHPLGAVILDGFGRYRTYYKEGIDRYEVDWHVFRVGQYKSAVEPYLRDNMSDQDRDSSLEWMGDLWEAVLDDMSSSRGVERATLDAYAQDFGEYLRTASGDAAQAALDAGLVDHLSSRHDLKQRMIELVGADEEKEHTYSRIGFESYLETLDESERTGHAGSGDKVAVIVAKGSIMDGNQPPGSIGGESTAALIRKARQDDDVKALVLRVDSGGGSAFASEVIRNEFALARAEGLPVVVSMGSVAASGGYWIATESDEIWASPNTITGSIGIFSMFPTFQKPMAKYLGWKVDGVGTSPLAGAMRPDREMQPEIAEAMQLMINEGYEDFLSRVSTAREMSREDVHAIAQGRVWSGADAHELGLVDKLGNLSDAVASAAQRAGMEGEYGVWHVEEELEFKDQVLIDMLSTVSTWIGPETRAAVTQTPQVRFARFMAKQLETFEQFNDPRGMYAHCLCEIE